MNNEENEQEQQEQNTLEKKMIDEGRDVARRGAKNIFKKGTNALGKKAGGLAAKAAAKAGAFIAANIVPISIMLVALIIFSFVASSFFVVQDKLRDVGKSVSSSIANILKIGDNGPLVPSKKELLESIDTELDNLGLKKENLYLGNENQANAYLYKYMVASLSTQLPYIEDSTAEKITNIALHLNPVTFLLAELDKEQEVQGIVKIKRCTPGSNIPKELKYLKYGESNENDTGENSTGASNEKTFSKLVEEDNSSALNYFSIDENWMLCVAKYQEVTVSGTSSDHTYTIDEVKIPYQTMLQNYSIPFSFFLTLQQMTQNPEYVSAVADMIMDQGEIELTLYDTIETITSEYTYKYDVMRKWLEEVEHGGGSISIPDGNGQTGGANSGSSSGSAATRPIITDRSNIKRIATTPSTGAKSEQASGGASSTHTEIKAKQEIVSTDNKEVTITTTVTNTIIANVTKANVWVIEHTAEYEKYEPDPEYPLGENGITTDLEDESEPEGDEGEWKVNRSETTKETNIKKGWKLKNSETEIEPDIFLGMWKNMFGIYIEGAKFEPKGKLVKYRLPKQYESTDESETETAEREEKGRAPSEVLLSAKDMFLYLLETREDTQTHAQIMRELINYYEAKINGNDYEINIDLSIFDISEFNSTTNASTGSGNVHNTKYTREEFIQIVNSTSPPPGKEGGYNKYFKAYAGDFYDIATKYGLNPEFIFCIGIHESDWGTSRIIQDKNNAFGYGAVDGSAYASAWSFASMKEGIEQECKDLANNFLNPSSWKYQRIASNGYDPNSIDGIGSLYASDGSWAKKVKQHMQNIFGYLDTGITNATGDSNSIVELAKTKLGCAYVWGATGPDTFDCSGFVQWVFKNAANIDLPRTANEQAASLSGREVSFASAKPGDIVWRSGHIGIYIGGNQYIHAPHTGDVVKISGNASGSFTKVFRVINE